MYKISSRYLEIRLSFAPLNAQKGHFLHYLRGFQHFSIFNLIRPQANTKEITEDLLHSSRIARSGSTAYRRLKMDKHCCIQVTREGHAGRLATSAPSAA